MKARATRKQSTAHTNKEGGLFISKHRRVAAWNNSGVSLASVQTTLLCYIFIINYTLAEVFVLSGYLLRSDLHT